MTLKNAALFALLGTALLTILLATDFISSLAGVLSDVIPVVRLLASFVHVLAGVSLTVFLYAFHKAQS